jgi:hypothetical protein
MPEAAVTLFESSARVSSSCADRARCANSLRVCVEVTKNKQLGNRAHTPKRYCRATRRNQRGAQCCHGGTFVVDLPLSSGQGRCVRPQRPK